MSKFIPIMLTMFSLAACGSGKGSNAEASDGDAGVAAVAAAAFDADSAYSYVKRQVDFGPRVPNSEAHRLCGQWLESELARHGAEVISQKADLKAFDGTVLKATNIFARYNPEASDRLLLLAHWDCRPWADQDPDPANRLKPVDGANDGASGVGVLLELARQIKSAGVKRGIDILLVDAEDWGTEGDDSSWALGTRYFIENPPVEGYAPSEAILLDMVGGKGATFCREYFSEKAAPQLASKIWGIADETGYGDLFLNRLGGAVTDDHVQLISHGVPAIDIIEYHPDGDTGFNPAWHTVADDMTGIDPATLKAVGSVVMTYINQ